MGGDQARTAIVTGPGGLGFEIASGLARAGFHVVLAGRDSGRGEAAVVGIGSPHVRFETLDLADLASVSAFSERMREALPSLDLLVNNAGVMTPPRRRVTKDGFELQFGTNHLGHFALTADLMPLLRRASSPRVVSVSSLAHLTGRMRFGNLQRERGYIPWGAYGQSKLAALMFALELQRRSEAGGWGITSVAAHPGLARTRLFANGPGWRPFGIATRIAALLFGQSASRGAAPILLAATSPDARGGDYFGPGGVLEMTGPPQRARIARHALDPEVARRLWEVSETLTGRRF